MRRTYEEWNPKGESAAVVVQANTIVADYRSQGYTLTLRQLYYQFVARGLIPNNHRSYKRLGSIVNKARLAGLMDWSAIEDRTRNLRGGAHWATPDSVVKAAADGYALDMWADQPYRVEVWVEKEALAGVIQRAAGARDVDWFSCRGYVSQSELWSAARRHLRYIRGGQRVLVLHLGDHDPSGIDMTRDMASRLDDFLTTDWLNDYSHRSTALIRELRADMAEHVANTGPAEGTDEETPAYEFRRIALNMDQVEEYDPPPNPAKLTDSRSDGYCDLYGDESWELDALDPSTLAALIEDNIAGVIDFPRWNATYRRQEVDRVTLTAISDNYDSVAEFLAEDVEAGLVDAGLDDPDDEDDDDA